MKWKLLLYNWMLEQSQRCTMVMVQRRDLHGAAAELCQRDSHHYDAVSDAAAACSDDLDDVQKM